MKKPSPDELSISIPNTIQGNATGPRAIRALKWTVVLTILLRYVIRPLIWLAPFFC